MFLKKQFKTHFLFLACVLLVLLGNLTAQASLLLPEKVKTIAFKNFTKVILPKSNQYYFFRVNEHQQITYIRIHETPVSYSYDTYNAFPYYDTLIPPHSEPLEISIHTFLHNDNPNKVTVELRTTETPSIASLKGHKELKAGFSAIMRHYLKETKEPEALQYFESAQQAFEQDNNHLWAGITANEIAGTYRSMAQYTKSISTYKKAINHFIQAKSSTYRWYSEGRMGLAEWRLNKIEQAQKRFEQVAIHGKQLGLSKLVKTAYNNIGLMHWAKRDIHAAIGSYRESLKLSGITEAQLRDQDISGIGFNHISLINNLALAYQNLGQTNNALKIYKSKIKAAESNKDQNGLFSGLINIANLLQSESLHDQALSQLQQALELEQNNPNNTLNLWWSNQLQIQFGRIYMDLGLNDLALNHYQQVLKNTNAENYKRQHLDVLLTLSEIQNHTKEAKKWLNDAENLARGADLPVQKATILQLQAQQAFNMQQPEKAIALFSQAKLKLQDLHKQRQVDNISLQLANVYQSQKKHQQAIKELESALHALPSKLDKILTSKILNALAFNQWKAGKKSEALITVKKSVDKLNELSQHVSHSKTQQQLKLHVDETLTLYSMLFAKEQDPVKTVSFINTTLQAWQSHKSNKALSPQPKNDPNTRNQNRASELFNQIGHISFALENNRLSDETRETMEREIISLNNELDYLSTINKIQTPKIDITAMQAAMEKDELTIQFMTGQYGSIAWWISKDKIICVPLENREKLATWVEHTRQTIADQAKLNQAIIELTEHLFTPLADYPEVDKVNLILDDPLNVLPIAALPLPKTSAPMVDRYTIQSFNSLSFVQNSNTAKKEHKTWQAAYFANPVHHSKDARLITAVRTDIANPNDEKSIGITEFTPLAGTAHEVNAINALISGQVFQGFEASKNNFTNLDQNTSILHMATHAFFNEEHPDLSSLVLSAYDKKGKHQASMVRASEIRNMEMPFELVVLSGCETGLSSGNGLTGLTQSFLQAGTKNIVSSLWQVDDRATSMMMTLLYQNLNEGQSIETALRNAQIHIKNQHQTRHPKYWSGWLHVSQ
ncbi:CHAT domain-containing protein [Marinicella rhabdoformis]|uniref:CHAT domain-containing protein n=1 Tax=Marinicella rhabdoformis TaxID=2580566 RepID=UPI0012AECA3C|nr:CHAT domain-containing protein [Marinicella rhabdoformis]